jgi:alpha-galactosidase
MIQIQKNKDNLPIESPFIRYKYANQEVLSSFSELEKEDIWISSCKRFQIRISRDFSKKKNSFHPSLIWLETSRPPIGFLIYELVIPIPFESTSDGYQIYRNGYQSWSISHSHRFEDTDHSPIIPFLQYSQENIFTQHTGIPGEIYSEGFIQFFNEKEDSGYLMGVTESGSFGVKFFTRVNEHGMVSHLSVIFDIQCNPNLKPSIALDLNDIIIIDFKGSPEKSLSNYWKDLGQANQIPDLPKKVPTGWCSWYYYFTNISEKVILENLYVVNRIQLPVEFFQIDDGYQKEIGDWLIPNEKFPHGVSYLAEEIRKFGYKPGIWLAPFLVRKNSEFFKLYPEAVLKDEDGNPVPALWNYLWGWTWTYALDITHPASLDYLEKVFRTLTKEWGFQYLKLDFLYAGLLKGDPYNKNISPHERYKQALDLIRNTVGKNVFLLGCGAPIIPSIGYFDGMRIGADVAPSWGPDIMRIWAKDRNVNCTENSLLNSVTRASMHRKLWLNDPDCLLVRKENNSMSYDQTILMASIMTVSGGMLLVSDDLTKLDQERINLLNKSLDLSAKCQGKTPLPLGLYKHKFPRGMWNPSGYVGIWNPTEHQEELKIEAPIEGKPKLIDEWTSSEINYSIEKIDNRIYWNFSMNPFQSYVFAI